MIKNGSEFDRGDLAANIAEKTGIDKGVVLDVLAAMPGVIGDALAEFERVEFHHLGVIRLERRAPRTGIGPNGERWEVPERLNIELHAAPALAEIVAERTGISTY